MLNLYFWEGNKIVLNLDLKSKSGKIREKKKREGKSNETCVLIFYKYRQ